MEPRPTPSPVTHEFAALAYCIGGSAEVEQQGRWSLRPGNVLLVPAGQPHRLVERAGPVSWGLGFCVACVAADDAIALLEPFERVRAGSSPIVNIPAARHAFLERLFEELHGEVDRVDGESLAVQRSLMTLILNEVHRAAQWQTPAAAIDSVVAQSLRFIERRCLGALTLADVAAAVNRSPAHVTTVLKRATGRSAVEWIISGRMAEARRRLLHSDEMVEIIAERVGYADATHFIRLFRRAHGVTPAVWRAGRRGARSG